MDILKAIGLAKEYKTVMEYPQLKEYFRFKIGKNFKKGIIDDEEIDLYFGFGFREEGMPVGQLHIENKKHPDGMMDIRVQLATYWIVLLLVVPFLVLIVLSLTSTSPEIALPLVIFGYVFCLIFIYSILFISVQSSFEDQFKKFIEMFQESERRYL